MLKPTRVGLPHDLHIRATLDILTGLSLEIIWLFCPCFLARTFFLIKLSPPITILFKFGKTADTVPVLPLSFPLNIIILSPFFNFME
ncbi:MAG: hypothetical protein A3C81_02645 [Candidatus Yanofskybacteria bacterium RIFCSPHIGHO2_02_FULL_46_19]|uniref:Uncharacterized protein n=2 Tax=Candidatus Yanofskyibacteriota TaxID=1752733 RepID=A0A1F8H489_9BACT|nr:MAG: hypothetical protein A3C81_02645 [Candidatus Yanofskybacteria bacterium RIFCSPHIGHO2_02_FULL_46_19]OGN27003.1 MAG: hypothetical protein A3B17_03185 [Candidatus Yanofskybacteria bacterium RIFCSPLOWO2_01_FULL_45_72]OGN32412.1 MAG: hypothetical protein A3J01_00635 [Candidatus Yanofskybacteria bacterium RIFCSPLOWO2_02_FULL_45_18]